jgi:hypothetical protein
VVTIPRLLRPLFWRHRELLRGLDLGLSPPENERPPPEIRYVPIDDEGRELVGSVAEAHAAP